RSSRTRRRARRALSRRAFLKRTAVAGGALVSAALVSKTQTAAAQPPAGSTMVRRTLGRTDLRVSEIGFGGFPVSDPDIVRYAIDRGIDYIDTAHCYRGGRSEEVIGAALVGRRDKVVLTTKWCPHHIGREPKKQVFLDMLDGSLKRLRTDHVDVVLNHEVGANSDGVGVERLKNPEMFEAFEAARKAGKARFLGASGHDPDLMGVMHHAVDSGRFDVLLCRYSFLDYPEQDRLIDKAHAKGVGFIAMKTLAGAKGEDLDRFRDRYGTFKQAALKWVLSNPRVSNLIISINSRQQVDEYVPASGRPLEKADLNVLKDYEETFSTEVCRFSGACLPACPENVRIADILRFSMYHNEYKQESRALESYARLVAGERAAHCAHCAGFCEQACAYDLPIKTLLIRAHRTLRPRDEA
ncbi:MAG TPA: aldo/keto reductase, partial [Candidatus Polarisedimenticolia bacterium]|nr:aldo/keto reductase [Candidatus Polarisedimenticolia bacterium]